MNSLDPAILKSLEAIVGTQESTHPEGRPHPLFLRWHRGPQGTAGMCGVHSQLGASFWRSEVGAGAPNSRRDAWLWNRLSGGSLPSHQCIVLCSVKMNRILDLDAANLTLEVEPGATTLAIAEAAEKAGLFYPPDPGSMKISTIGGNVAENSGGLRGLKYGVTRNYVMGLEVVLPDGSICYLGNKCVKDVAGYSLKDLLLVQKAPWGLSPKSSCASFLNLSPNAPWWPPFSRWIVPPKRFQRSLRPKSYPAP